MLQTPKRNIVHHSGSVEGSVAVIVILSIIFPGTSGGFRGGQVGVTDPPLYGENSN